MGARKKHYAVRVGRVPGVYRTWDECRAQVERFPHARFKGFETEAEARAFVRGDAGKDGADGTGAAEAAPAHGASALERGAKRKLDAERAPPAKAARRASTDTAPPAPAPPSLCMVPLDARDAASELPASAAEAVARDPAFLDVYTDGSAHGNGRASSVAGYGVYWAEQQYAHLNLAEPLDEAEAQTNNRAELRAILEAIRQYPDASRPLRIWTDSTYSIKALTKWMPGWKRRQWRRPGGGEPVANVDLLQALDAAIAAAPHPPVFLHVRGHTGHFGNTMADQLANAGAAKSPLARGAPPSTASRFPL